MNSKSAMTIFTNWDYDLKCKYVLFLKKTIVKRVKLFKINCLKIILSKKGCKKLKNKYHINDKIKKDFKRN